MKTVIFQEHFAKSTNDPTDYIYYKQVKPEDIVIVYQTDISSKPLGIVIKHDEYIIIQRGSANTSVITFGQPRFDKIVDFLQFHSFNYTFKIVD